MSKLNQSLDISNPEPAIFLHIQKTAGTSLVHAAAEQYGAASIISHGDYIGKSPLELSNIHFISGHFGYAYIEPIIQNRKIFTFLREPRERIVSLYYYFRSQPIETYPIYKLAHENSLEVFLKLAFSDAQVRARIWNHQTWQLAYGYNTDPGRRFMKSFTPIQLLSLANYNLRKMHFVGLVESFDQDIGKLARLLKWNNITIAPCSNKNHNRKSLSDLSTNAIKLLDELTLLDQELYHAAILLRSERKDFYVYGQGIC